MVMVQCYSDATFATCEVINRNKHENYARHLLISSLKVPMYIIIIYIQPSPPPRIIAIRPRRKRSSVAPENANNNKRDGKTFIPLSRSKAYLYQTHSSDLFSLFFLFFVPPLTRRVLTRVYNNNIY